MNRLAVVLAPLILAAGAFSAHAQDPHAGHNMPPAPRTQPATPVPDPHAGHRMPAPVAAPDPHAGHVMPTAQAAKPSPQPTPAPTAPAVAKPDPHAEHKH